MLDNLKLLAGLYVRPLSALSEIIDEGSLLFGAAAVLAVSLLSGGALNMQVASAYTPFIPTPGARSIAASPAPGAPAAEDPAYTEDEYDPAFAQAMLTARALGGARLGAPSPNEGPGGASHAP